MVSILRERLHSFGLPEFEALVAINLIFSILIPWACIRYKFGRASGLLYLYGSMIPILAMTVWFIPQMMILAYMLLPLVHPEFSVLWLLAPFTHNWWLPALVIWVVGLGSARWKGIL